MEYANIGKAGQRNQLLLITKLNVLLNYPISPI